MSGREFDHFALLVRIPKAEQFWLADFDFGDSFFEPLLFEPNKDQAQGLRAFRLEPAPGGYDLLRRDFDRDMTYANEQ